MTNGPPDDPREVLYRLDQEIFDLYEERYVGWCFSGLTLVVKRVVVKVT